MLRVEHHWDPLQVCLVGTTYDPKLYDFVQSTTVRKTLQTISEQTLEDLENLCNVLESFGVETHQPNISSAFSDVTMGDKMLPAPLTPRDYTAMIDSVWFMPEAVREEEMAQYDYTWLKPIEQLMHKHGNTVHYNTNGIIIDSAMIHRCGDTLLVGNWTDGDDNSATVDVLQKTFPNKTVHLLDTQGHLDGVLCQINCNTVLHRPDWTDGVPGCNSIPIPHRKGTAHPHIEKYWLPEYINSVEFENFVEENIAHWIGHVSETFIDVNMLIVDKYNVIMSVENPELIKILETFNISVTVVPLRNQLFWDGGIHCVTSDMDRAC